MERNETRWEQKCKEMEMYIGGMKCTEAWNFVNKDSTPMQR